MSAKLHEHINVVLTLVHRPIPANFSVCCPMFSQEASYATLTIRHTGWNPGLLVRHWAFALLGPYCCHHSPAHQQLVHSHPDPYTYSGFAALLEPQVAVGTQVVLALAVVLRTQQRYSIAKE